MKKVILILSIAVVLIGYQPVIAGGHKKAKSEKPAKEHKACKHGKNWKGGTFE